MAGLTVTHCLFERSCSLDDTCMQLPCQCQRRCVQHRWARTLVKAVCSHSCFFTIPKRQNTEHFQKKFFILNFYLNLFCMLGKTMFWEGYPLAAVTMHTRKWKQKSMSHQRKKHINCHTRQRNTSHLEWDKETHNTSQQTKKHITPDNNKKHITPPLRQRNTTPHTRPGNTSHQTSKQIPHHFRKKDTQWGQLTWWEWCRKTAG